MMQRPEKSLRIVIATAVLASVGLSGCSGGVGDGETISRIDIQTTDGAIRAFQCFYSSLQAIATFEGGGQEDVTFRGNWSSSDPSMVAVSNGKLKTPLGLSIRKGTIAPKAAPQVGAATISFEFVGLSDKATVNIEPARLEITPATFTLAEGTGVNFVANGLLGDSAAGDLIVLFANFITNWTVSNETAASITNLGRNQSGGSLSTNDVDSDTQVTVAAVTDMEDCNQPGQAGYASARANILNERFERLEFRRIDLDATRANSSPLDSPMAQGTDQLYRVLGVDDDRPFRQDLTSRISGRQGRDAAVDEGVFSDDGEVISILGTSLSALPLDTSASANITARLEQLDTTVETAAPETITVNPAILQEIDITPSSQNAAPGTSLSYRAQGTFDIAPTNQDISVNVLWSSSDTTNAPIGLGGLVGIDEDAIDTTGILINASAPDDPFQTPTLQNTISSEDAGNTATLNIVSFAAGNTLTVDWFGDDQQPRDTSCPDIGSDNDVTNDPVVGSRCFLQALGDNGQDISTQVVWESSNTAVGIVGNAAPLISEFSALASGSTTVTARYFDSEGEQVATGSFNVTVP